MLRLESVEPFCAVVFAVGAGGNPERHLPLLTSLAENGCAVVAPHFERLASPRPSEAELLFRAQQLKLALDSVDARLPVVGLGHSIGATTLLALAGAQIWMGPGRTLPIPQDVRLRHLLLMAPATGFFQAQGALDCVRVPTLILVGANDTVTTPAQAEFLRLGLEGQAPVELQILDGAGHFSFMHALPPQVVDTFADREAFLADLTVKIRRRIVDWFPT